MFSYQHFSIFPEGHPIHHRYRLHADEGTPFALQYGTIDIMSVGIWTIKDDQWLPVDEG